MKSRATTTALLFVLFGTGSLAAQQPLFAPLGAVWHYDIYNCPPLGNIAPYEVAVTVDTIINGKYCTQLHNNYCHSDASCNNGYVYVHQDGSKVFIYEPLFNDFQMMYDFSLQTGDSYTYRTCVGWGVDTVTVHVDFADDDPTGLQWLRIVPNQPTWWSDITVEIVKGVGKTTENNVLLFPDDCVSVDCPWFSFKCYETPDSINYPAGCFVSAAGDIPLESNRILLFPNPASGFLNIELTTQKMTGNPSLRISDACGRFVKDIMLKPAQKKHMLPVQDWPAGMYFLQYLEDGEVKAAERFVVQK